MAKFKCLLSGNVIEFTHQVDIDSMYGHEGYVRLDEQQDQQEASTPIAKAPVVKKTQQSKAKVKTTITEE